MKLYELFLTSTYLNFGGYFGRNMTFPVGAIMFVKEKQRPNDSSASHASSEGIAMIIGGEYSQSSIATV